MSDADELASLLAEDAGAARLRAARMFNDARQERPVVLVGAGNLGKRAAAAMRADGDVPVAFADRDQSIAGRTIEGVPVLSITDAVSGHKDALFVVTIWGALSEHRIAHTQRELAALGVKRVAPFAHLFWRYQLALPHYLVDLPHAVLEERADVERAFTLFTDGRSRAEFVAHIRARLSGEVHAVAEPVAQPQYLAADLIAWSRDESVVDGGAFDGDTLRSWIAHCGLAFAAWTAFEPQPETARAFARTVATLPEPVRCRVQLHQMALGARRERISFTAVASPGASRAAASGVGDVIEVSVAPLDEVQLDVAPTFVKCDIEGAELDALAGMCQTVARARPVLAICAYHRQDHLWRVPLAIASMCEDYDVVLRPYGAEGWDLVCFGIPRERRNSAVREIPIEPRVARR